MQGRIVKASEPQYLVSLSANSVYPGERGRAFRTGVSHLVEIEKTMRALGWQHITITEMAYSDTLGRYVAIPE